MKKKTGAYEWGGKMLTVLDGCGNGGCRYCYAREFAVRYGRCTADQWANVKVRQQEIDRPRPLYKHQPVFFQSSSDITPPVLSECMVVLRKLLDAGNKVLIVSKPHCSCITVICEAYPEFKEQIEFRFTIGSTDNEVLNFWEPNAPAFHERLACLEYAYIRGYRTSVSCEPFLDAWPMNVYAAVLPYTTESFWLGMLRSFNQRVRLDGITDYQRHQFVEPLRKLQNNRLILAMVDALKDKRLVQFKDSIKEVIEANARTELENKKGHPVIDALQKRREMIRIYSLDS